jgi:hypothetical protein
VLAVLFAMNKQNVIRTAVLVVFTLMLLVLQSYTVKAGQRDKLPVFNVITGRIAQAMNI